MITEKNKDAFKIIQEIMTENDKALQNLFDRDDEETTVSETISIANKKNAGNIINLFLEALILELRVHNLSEKKNDSIADLKLQNNDLTELPLALNYLYNFEEFGPLANIKEIDISGNHLIKYSQFFIDNPNTLVKIDAKQINANGWLANILAEKATELLNGWLEKN